MKRNSKLFAIGCLLLVCLSIFIYTINKNGQRQMKGINSNEVQQINLFTRPSLFEEISITGEDQINIVIDYLNSLTTIRTRRNANEYTGMAYTLKIKFKTGADRTLSLLGNKFIVEQNGTGYEIPYDEAVKFDVITAKILESSDVKKGLSSISGTIVSVNSETGGRNVSCVIKDKNNTIYNVSLKNTPLIDATGKGWLILHKEDTVKVYYENDRKNNGNIDASRVYIKTSYGQ